ncbi:MAG TPA: cytochrome c3 family protein [Candidatus Deferrimicrobium sp.]|nr:cytochrome c3 family protein [Candidatus Deferrimicrobium sp.]
MKQVLPILAVMLLSASAAMTLAADDNCLTCHQSFEDETAGPSHIIVRDVHYQRGISCADCHGGSATLEDMEEVRREKSYRGVPGALDVPLFCARCHSDAAYMHEHNPGLPVDQLEKYKTSVHGHLLLEKKDPHVATCTSCHGVHDIGSAKLPHSKTYPLNIPQTCGTCHADEAHMAPYGIPTDQVEAYAQSVHGQALLERKDLGAPACNDCHGNHGAAPPGVASLSAVCGTCHALEADLFVSSPHKAAFEANDYPMCETCHSNHRIVRPLDAWIGTAEPALCVNCHGDADGTRGFETARGISKAIADLAAAHGQAETALEEAVTKGMMTTDEEFRLKEVDQNLIQTRTLVHAFNMDSVSGKAEEGLQKARQVQQNSARLVDEYYFRRKGLGLATLGITILVVGLYLMIKRLG